MYLTLTLVIICFIVSLLLIHRRHAYFKEHGIDYAPGIFPLGSHLVWKVFMGQESFLQLADAYYNQFENSKAFGFYKPLGEPVLVIKDMELAKKIMITDFDHFVDRNFFKSNPKSNLHESMMLLALKGENWKKSRNLLTPMFSSRKLKATMPLMHQCAQDLSKYLEDCTEIDCKEVFQRFTVEILGTLGCGVKPNVLRDVKNDFYKHVLSISNEAESIKISTVLRLAVGFLFPDLFYNLGLSIFERESVEYFVQIITASIESRKVDGKQQRRNDFIDLLRDTFEELDHYSESEFQDFAVANSLMLFIVGNDTSSGCLALAFHYLAKYPHIQEKLYDEIQEAIEANDGQLELDYAALNNMQYMGKFINETIRCWGVNFFDRTCTKDYYVADLNYTIPKGMHVTLAGGALQRDAAYFENPLEFDPEAHFGSKSSYFLGFGQGPRNCIGLRFASTIVRTGLLYVLSKYKVLKGPNSKEDWYFSPIVAGGIGHKDIYVQLEARH